METTANSAHEPISARIVYTYALGDFCFTFFILFIGYYLMYYLTDVLVLPATTAAAIYTLVQFFETAGILVGGVVIDRLKLKGGKYRPWLLIGGLWCGISLVFLFTKYNISQTAYIYLFPLLYLITYWGYNFMWVAFRSLPGRISNNQQDVMSLAVGSQRGAVAASLVYSMVGVKLLYGFQNIATGYTISSLVYGSVIILCMAQVYRITKPYDYNATEGLDSQHKERISFRENIRCLAGPMLPYFLSSVLRSSVSVAIPALMVYYFNYVLKSDSGMTLYLSTSSVIQILAAWMLKPLSVKYSKISLFRGTAVLSCLSTLLAFVFGRSVIPFVFFMALNNFALVLGSGMSYAFITDIADYNEYIRGLHTRGFTVSLSGTANTLASLIGGGIASFSLAFIGYDASIAAQSASLSQGIRLIVTVGASAMTAISLIPFAFYNLNEKKMAEVYAHKNQIRNQNSSHA